jgi:hypothetical protein
VQRSRIYPATIGALEIVSAMGFDQKFIKSFVKINIEIMVRNSQEKVFGTECVFVIVDRAATAISTRFKQLAEYVDKFSLIIIIIFIYCKWV